MHPSPALGPVLRHRAPLQRSRAALNRGALTLGFLGGSITAPKTGTRWPEPLIGWLTQRYPFARLRVENAALGATGSDLGVFRAGPEIIARDCDLVFVEYAVNDIGQPTDRRNRTREGLLRQLLAAGCDVVNVYAFCPEMLVDMEAGRGPPTIAEFEVLAGHYGIGSVWMGLHAWTEVQRGLMTWSEWLPDGLHPESRGSLSYAQGVIAFCEAAWNPPLDPAVAPAPTALPAALHEGCWEKVNLLPLEQPECTGPWSLQRWWTCLGVTRVLHTTAPGARLRFSFHGRGLVLGFDFGRSSGEVRFRVDQGEWVTTQRERPDWVGDSGWFRPTVVADDLVSGSHRFELETLTPLHAGRLGSTTTLAFFGILQ